MLDAAHGNTHPCPLSRAIPLPTNGLTRSLPVLEVAVGGPVISQVDSPGAWLSKAGMYGLRPKEHAARRRYARSEDKTPNGSEGVR